MQTQNNLWSNVAKHPQESPFSKKESSYKSSQEAMNQYTPTGQ